MKDTTIVLGGGGVWGVAWMTGLLKGLADGGVDLTDAGAFIGTSAGSVVSAQVTSGMPIAGLFQRQIDQALQPRESLPQLQGLGALGEILQRPAQDHVARARQIGSLALKAKTISFAQRRADIAERLGLPSSAWPAKRLTTTAVDAESADLVTFNASSGVSLVDAVATSCAVPGIWPVVPINGGVWLTPENAHLAAGAQSVIIIAPVGSAAAPESRLKADIAMLEKTGAKVVLIEPDKLSKTARGTNLLDPATRRPAAEAGLAQGRLCLDEVVRGLR